MTLHLLPVAEFSAENVRWLANGADIHVTHVRAELDNMTAALARYHGEQKAQLMVGDAFALAFACWARESGRPSVFLFALQAAIDNALAHEYPQPEGPAAA